LGVIIQATYQPGYNFKSDTTLSQLRRNAIEMLPAFRTQVIQNGGEVVDDGMFSLHFAVKYVKRVGLSETMAVSAQVAFHLLECPPQNLQVFRTTLLATHRVDEKAEIRQSHPVQEQDQHLQHFSIDRGVIGAQHLGADLVELPVASFL